MTNTHTTEAGASRAFHRRWWLALDHVQRGLLGLLLVRLALDLLFVFNILPLELRIGWFLQHGGDHQQMMDLARSILDGVPRQSVVGIGQALVMMPWIVLLRPAEYIDMVVPLMLINGFLLGGLSVLLVGGIARHIIRSDRFALWSAAIWAILPLIFYFGFFWHPEGVFVRSAMVPKVAWLNGLSDGPAAFFLLLAIFLLAGVSEAGREVSFWRMAGVGAALGAAVIFRFHTSPMIAFLLLYVLVVHGWRAFLAVCGAGLLIYLPQAWYNQAVFGIPFTTGYISYGDVGAWSGTLNRPLRDILTNLPFHPRNLLDTLAYFLERRAWLLAPLAAVLAVVVFMFISLWRQRGWRLAALLWLAPLAYLLPLLTAYNFRDDVVRFSIPVIPAAIMAVVYTVMWVAGWLKQRWPGVHPSTLNHKR